MEVSTEIQFASTDDVRGIIRIRRDGTIIKTFDPYMNGAGGNFRVSQSLSANETGLSAGSHTYSLSFERQGGGSTVTAYAGTMLRVEEIKK